MKKFILPIVLIVLMFIINISFTDTLPQDPKTEKQLQTEKIITNELGTGQSLEILFEKGEEHNHPLMAVWVEDTAGKFIQTLYVSQSIGTGIFNYGDHSAGRWKQGEVRRPAALPYWSHQRGIMSEDSLYVPSLSNPVPDAYTGPTPKNSFLLATRLDEVEPAPVNVFLEINQPWDWNEFWTNAKYPDDADYKSSSQPAVVYRATVDLSQKGEIYPMKVVGHSHYAGRNGELYDDIGSLTTALMIVGKIEVRVK